LLKDRFDSRDHIDRVPCLCPLVVANDDVTIPVAVSRTLFAGWPGELTEFVVPYCGHQGLMNCPDVHRASADFLLD
jgi:hypothetical protein